ncbi:MAG: flagellar hook-basal body complex protein FliE [Planctomycetes bacterium]|nr:flagellar hook-basal body complex protein FliE [Planctomycetota bacterium]
MINFNTNIGQGASQAGFAGGGISKGKTAGAKSGFANSVKAAREYISKVDDLQETSDISIKDLLSGKNEDITSVVSAVAKADMSFKLLVGVRNKLVEAYKETMKTQL